jgi:hypothetical protein
VGWGFRRLRWRRVRVAWGGTAGAQDGEGRAVTTLWRLLWTLAARLTGWLSRRCVLEIDGVLARVAVRDWAGRERRYEA